MPRKSTFTPEMTERGKKLRADGVSWIDIAAEMGVKVDMVLYHCSPNRKNQIMSAVKHYHKNNYEKVREKQREYARNYYATRTKVQPKTGGGAAN